MGGGEITTESFRINRCTQENGWGGCTCIELNPETFRILVP